MRILITFLTLSFLLAPAGAQEPEEWALVYRFEGAKIDLDQTAVTVGSHFTGRVRFRITYDKAIPLPEQKEIKYKRVIQTVEFKCPERRYRILQVQRFDSKGKVVDTETASDPTEWKEIQSASIMDKLIVPACELIREKQ